MVHTLHPDQKAILLTCFIITLHYFRTSILLKFYDTYYYTLWYHPYLSVYYLECSWRAEICASSLPCLHHLEQNQACVQSTSLEGSQEARTDLVKYQKEKQLNKMQGLNKTLKRLAYLFCHIQVFFFFPNINKLYLLIWEEETKTEYIYCYKHRVFELVKQMKLL